MLQKWSNLAVNPRQNFDFQKVPFTHGIRLIPRGKKRRFGQTEFLIFFRFPFEKWNRAYSYKATFFFLLLCFFKFPPPQYHNLVYEVLPSIF